MSRSRGEQTEAEHNAEKLEARMDDRVAGRIGRDPEVSFSAYELDENGDTVRDNLDDVPIPGKVRLVRGPGIWTDGHFETPVLDDPSWLELCYWADQMIRISGDYHHHYLEAVEVVSESDGVKTARFIMGS